MPTRSLPSHPSLAQLKLQAKELQRAHAAGDRCAAARVLGHHPRMRRGSSPSVLDKALPLADAQLVLAREFGFRNWADLKHYVELAGRLGQFEPHARFDDAVAALDAGEIGRLRALLAGDPALGRARTNLAPPYGYFTGATLLHHVAGNPRRDAPLPRNVVEVARVLLDAGADVHAETLGPNGGTTMGLLVTSKHANDVGATVPLMDLLLEYGATLDLEAPDVLDASLANHAPRAAERMIELGAKPDLFAVAALGHMDLLRAAFDKQGRLRSRPRRRGALMSDRDAIGLALLYAYVRQQADAVDFLLEHDGNWNMTGVNNGTVLHRAAWDGDLAMVQRLVANGADTNNRANPFNSTPLSWAAHNKQQDIVQWMRAHCAIDLHDGVCFGFREHVEARLREDPTAVNRLIDQWDIPRCAPLHWAVWLFYEDVDGTQRLDEARREELVDLLLDKGADPNIVAGNGLTALDMARASGATRIAALLERYGGERTEHL